MSWEKKLQLGSRETGWKNWWANDDRFVRNQQGQAVAVVGDLLVHAQWEPFADCRKRPTASTGTGVGGWDNDAWECWNLEFFGFLKNSLPKNSLDHICHWDEFQGISIQEKLQKTARELVIAQVACWPSPSRPMEELQLPHRRKPRQWKGGNWAQLGRLWGMLTQKE